MIHIRQDQTCISGTISALCTSLCQIITVKTPTQRLPPGRPKWSCCSLWALTQRLIACCLYTHLGCLAKCTFFFIPPPDTVYANKSSVPSLGSELRAHVTLMSTASCSWRVVCSSLCKALSPDPVFGSILLHMVVLALHEALVSSLVRCTAQKQSVQSLPHREQAVLWHPAQYGFAWFLLGLFSWSTHGTLQEWYHLYQQPSLNLPFQYIMFVNSSQYLETTELI